MTIEFSSITKWHNLRNAKTGEVILLEGDRGPYIVTDIPLERGDIRKALINLQTGEALYQPFGYYKRLNTKLQILVEEEIKLNDN